MTLATTNRPPTGHQPATTPRAPSLQCSPPPPYHLPTTTPRLLSSLGQFLAYADWGDDSPGQHAAAAGMGAVAEDINATMAFALGDNF